MKVANDMRKFLKCCISFLFKSVGKGEVREMNGLPIVLQFEFSSLASEQMQNHFGQTLPSLLSLLLYSNAPSYKAPG